LGRADFFTGVGSLWFDLFSTYFEKAMGGLCTPAADSFIFR
jgi:hypothetical protein